MDEVTKALYSMYPDDCKSDFYSAYLYLKYIDHFVYHAYKIAGLTPKDRKEVLPADIDEMLQGIVQRVAETSPSYDTSSYHGKVVKIQEAIQLVTQKESLTLIPPEQVIPFKVARDIVLKNPESIALGTCACRANSAESCLPPPMEVCIIVGEPFASFVAEKSPLFRKSSQAEAVKVLEAAHKRGDVQAAYFKKELGNRFYFICNCCSCCCLGIQMWNVLGGMIPILAPSGYVAIVDADKCNGCGSCSDCCHFKALTLGDQVAVIDKAKCMGCGVCEDMCPTGAIKLVRDMSKGLPLDLNELKKLQGSKK